jgi:hypothetical protein
MYTSAVVITNSVIKTITIQKSTLHCRRKNPKVVEYNFSEVNKDHHAARPVFNNCGRDNLLKYCK